jgi:hypothetical protein
MSSRNPDLDYFLVLQDPEHDICNIYAQGSGLETVEAIARLSVLASFSDEKKIDTYSAFELTTDLIKHRRDNTRSNFPFTHMMNATALSEVVSQSYNVTAWNFGEKLAASVEAGHRSPQSVIDQITQQQEDTEAVKRATWNWYDALGRERLTPYEASGGWVDGNTENLWLRPVKRIDKEYVIRPETKDALYAAVPKRAKVRYHNTLPFIGSEGYTPDALEALFKTGKKMVHRTFGHMKGDEFIPFVTELSASHPTVAKQAKQAAKTGE